jgi:hypothetical protein
MVQKKPMLAALTLAAVSLAFSGSALAGALEKLSETKLLGCHYAISRLSGDDCQGDPLARDRSASGGFCDELECQKGKKTPFAAVEAQLGTKKVLCTFHLGELHAFPIQAGAQGGALNSAEEGKTYGLNVQGFKNSCNRDFLSLRYGKKDTGAITFDASTHPSRDWQSAKNRGYLGSADKAKQRAESLETQELMKKDAFLHKRDFYTEQAKKNRIDEVMDEKIRNACKAELIAAIQTRASNTAALTKTDFKGSNLQPYAERLMRDCDGITPDFSEKLTNAFGTSVLPASSKAGAAGSAD